MNSASISVTVFAGEECEIAEAIHAASKCYNKPV